MKIYNWIILLVLASGIFFYRIILSALSINLLLLIDNALEFTKSLNPIVMWVILGLFVGLVYGAFTAWRKYKLDFKLNFIFVGLLLLFITLISFINQPVKPKGISFTTVEPLEPVSIAPKYAIITQNTSLYACPQSNCSILVAGLSKGNKVEILETRNDNWSRVKVNNNIGFIQDRYISFHGLKKTILTKGSVSLPTPSNNVQEVDSSNLIKESDDASESPSDEDTTQKN